MTRTPTTIRIFGIEPCSIVDGPGLRYAVFVQGCPHACSGCHNPESHDMHGGSVSRIDDIVSDIAASRHLDGVTLSGGDPFAQPEACAELARCVHELGYNVWTYTGYIYENLMAMNKYAVHTLLNETDVLVDGPFVQKKKSHKLLWRGSANQRVIDLAAMRAADTNKIIVWESQWKSHDVFPTKPQSW